LVIFERAFGERKALRIVQASPLGRAAERITDGCWRFEEVVNGLQVVYLQLRDCGGPFFWGFALEFFGFTEANGDEGGTGARRTGDSEIVFKLWAELSANAGELIGWRCEGLDVGGLFDRYAVEIYDGQPLPNPPRRRGGNQTTAARV